MEPNQVLNLRKAETSGQDWKEKVHAGRRHRSIQGLDSDDSKAMMILIPHRSLPRYEGKRVLGKG
jgi:hypothetical protein